MKFLVVVALTICGALAVPAPFAGPECKAPNGGGLQPVLEEFVKLLPIEELAKIYLTAVSTDPEVQAVMAYLESDDFKQFVSAVQGAPEFYKLLDYACDNLYLDLYYYFNVIGGIIGLPPVVRPPVVHLNRATRARPGLHGMLLDMIDVLPLDEIKALFEEKKESDEYVKKAIELLSSEDFNNIVKAVRSLNEYQKILDELRGMGVNVDGVIEALRKFFGWD